MKRWRHRLTYQPFQVGPSSSSSSSAARSNCILQLRPLCYAFFLVGYHIRLSVEGRRTAASLNPSSQPIAAYVSNRIDGSLAVTPLGKFNSKFNSIVVPGSTMSRSRTARYILYQVMLIGRHISFAMMQLRLLGSGRGTMQY